MTDFILKIAETEEEKLGAYKLRFQCLTLENGDTKYANYQDGTFIDPMDRTGKSILLIAKDVDKVEVVSTQRISFRKDEVFTADDIYPYKVLASKLKVSPDVIMQKAVLISRGATHAAYRKLKPGLFTRLYELSERLIVQKLGNQFLYFGYVSVDNLYMPQIFTQRFGWEELSEVPPLTYKYLKYILFF